MYYQCKEILYKYLIMFASSAKMFYPTIHNLKNLINTNIWLDDSVKLFNIVSA